MKPSTAILSVLSNGETPQRREPQGDDSAQGSDDSSRGFGDARRSVGSRRKGNRRRSPALSKADWGPLGKHPELEAIIARQRLGLPRSGRLTPAQVNQAWKRCASEHHPDRGGEHDAMQLVNGARDLLLGRDER
ncbi:MAG: molecular chaperone DnaJ [Synechococcaceae cyanobacterium]